MVELVSREACKTLGWELDEEQLALAAPRSRHASMYSLGSGSGHGSLHGSFTARRCQSWAPGSERVRVVMPLRPSTFLDVENNAHRVFGGIDRKVNLNLPTENEKKKFKAFARSFLRKTMVKQRRVVAFVNSRSGGQTGHLIMKTLSANLTSETSRDGSLLGEVCDLSQRGEPEATIARLAGHLQEESELRLEVRLLVCGGDGTVTWILTALEQCRELEDHMHRVPVGIVPLGTGNDLARSLGWGAKLRRVSDILEYLREIVAAEPVLLDQWRVVLRPHTPLPESHKLRTCGSHPQLVRDSQLAQQLWRDMLEALPADNADQHASSELFLGFWQNYFSVGMDAKVTTAVDTARSGTSCGRRCFSWGCGKVCYGWQGLIHACGSSLLDGQIGRLRATMPGASEVLQDVPLEGRCIRQLMFVNINSYGAGLEVVPRREACTEPSPNDGIMEMLSVRDLASGMAMMVGLRCAQYIASTRSVAFTLQEGQYMQLDGEPWELDMGCDVLVEPHREVPMLLAQAGSHSWRGPSSRSFWNGQEQPAAQSYASEAEGRLKCESRGSDPAAGRPVSTV